MWCRTSAGLPQLLKQSSGILQRPDLVGQALRLVSECAQRAGRLTPLLRVGIATQIGDPLGQMKVSGRAKSQGVDRDATALLTACGLALRSFD